MADLSIIRVGVVGAGTMGSGIAQVFAQAGFDVRLHDAAPAALDRARAGIERSLTKFVGKGTLSSDAKAAALAHLEFVSSMDAFANLDYVVEAVIEDKQVKQRVFERLDALLPSHAIISSNTSSISITELGGATGRPSQVVGMHFMNPVPLMPLVEVVRSRATSAQTIRTTVDLCRRLGKTPVEVNDFPGFVANRVLMPMINEAIFAVMDGVASPQAIDTIMQLGMNHPMGPLTLADFIGLDVCLAILGVLHEGFGDPKYQPCPLLVRMVAAGDLGKKSGRGFYTYA